MSDSTVEFSNRAHCKMLMHAAKYPHTAVNGLLLAPATSPSTSSPSKSKTLPLIISDAIPLFHHTPPGLAPMMEVALSQVESACSGGASNQSNDMQGGARLRIAGFYHANENFDDISVESGFGTRIVDKISENTDQRTILVTIDNRRLGMSMEDSAVIVRENSASDNRWKVKDPSAVNFENGAFDLAKDLIFQYKQHKNVFDFDNHLDDISTDYLNVKLNMIIDEHQANLRL